MKNNMKGIIQLALSILVYILLDHYFFFILGKVGLHLKGTAWLIANTIKYLLISGIIFAIYYGNIRHGQNKFNKAMLNNIIYSVACFVFLVVVTIVLHNLINYIGKPRGIEIGYHFTNYFNQRFTLSFALNLIIECVFMPFLLCVIFPLGFSNIFKRSGTASFLSGLTYGVIYAINLNTYFERALLLSITPAILIMLLSYLYKTNQNIWSVIVTYALYVLIGAFAINYIV